MDFVGKLNKLLGLELVSLLLPTGMCGGGGGGGVIKGGRWDG